jgi:hypothetical protein
MVIGSNLLSKVGNQEAAMELVSGFKKYKIQIMEVLVEQDSSAPEIEERLQDISDELSVAGKQLRLVKSIKPTAPASRPVANYYPWRLSRIEAVSEASALYSFTCFGVTQLRPAEKRRISGEVWAAANQAPCLWHTTLLADAPRDTEGPCPWVERDYTPVSTFSDWVLGTCDLLVKAYPGGRATQWLKRQAVGALVRLSEPKLTEPAAALPRLAMPRLLLVVGGTGVAVAVQALRALVDSPKPVAVVYSCRAGDALALADLHALVAQRAAAPGGGPDPPAISVQVLLTAPADPVAEAADLAARHPAIRFSAGRLDRDVLAAALNAVAAAPHGGARRPGPARGAGPPAWAAGVGIVVSGPAGMNSAVGRMLEELGLAPGAAAILQA